MKRIDMRTPQFIDKDHCFWYPLGVAFKSVYFFYCIRDIIEINIISRGGLITTDLWDASISKNTRQSVMIHGERNLIEL